MNEDRLQIQIYAVVRGPVRFVPTKNQRVRSRGSLCLTNDQTLLHNPMHKQPSTGRVVYNGAYSRDPRPVVLQNLIHGIPFAMEPGLAGIARDLEHAGRRAGWVSGVEYVSGGDRGLWPTRGPKCTFAVNHQVVDTALCRVTS